VTDERGYAGVSPPFREQTSQVASTGRVHLLGLAIGVNLNAYDARHQWTRDAVDTGNALVDILTAGGWSKDSPMVRRYSGERTITNKRIQLKRDVSGSTC
jgi:hypothetical protein